MAEEIVRYEDRDGAQITLTPDDVAMYCASGNAPLTQRDVVNFMATCKALGANPFLGDVYLVKYGSENASIMAGKNYYTRVAVSIPTYDGMAAGIVCLTQAGEVTYRKGSLALPGDTCIGGWAEVWDKRWTRPVRAEVAMEEYNSHRSLWKTKPLTMIRKVALVQALREAYPDRFAGTYDASEMGARGEAPAPAPAPQQVAVKVEPAPAPQPAPTITDEDKQHLAEAAQILTGLGIENARNLLWQAYKQGGLQGAREEYQRLEAQAVPVTQAEPEPDDEGLYPDDIDF